MKIHAIQTGWVQVKAAHRLLIGPEGLRLLTILGDPRWTEWLPIYAWVVEHPEGIIVIDTGESSHINEPTFFEGSDPANRYILQNVLRFRLTPDDEIGPQMRRVGISSNDVRWVIMTHLHSDHSDGMYNFPKAEYVLARQDYERALKAPRGSLPAHWPSHLTTTFVNFFPESYGAFSTHVPLTKQGDVVIVPTPGHTLYHQSVILQQNGISYLFAGDASFSQAQLFSNRVAGIVEDVRTARTTLQTIRAYLQEKPTVYLPSHDKDSAHRLAQNLTSVTTACRIE